MKRRAFTLVELMVAMAIIAVLLGMTVFGISAAQRVLRDNQRRKAVEDVALVLNEYLATFSEYPDDITFTSNTVTVATGYTVSLTGIAQAATTTDASQTAYCYELSTDVTSWESYLKVASSITREQQQSYVQVQVMCMQYNNNCS
jgi:prepilin-type N-terminal cleavage/methylation domain-containing protein